MKKTSNMAVSKTTKPMKNRNRRAAKAASPASIIQLVEQFLNKNNDFRFNTVTGKCEFKKKKTKDFVPLTDYILNSLSRELVNAGINCTPAKLRTILYSESVPVFNPFIDYLDKIPAWDGKIDYIQQLASTVQTTNDALWKKSFTKWFVAYVGSLLHERTINHCAIIFSGFQGVGKSSWFPSILPPELKDYLHQGVLDPRNKDSLIHLSECALIQMDELETLSKKCLGELKEFFTKTSIRIRRPYGYTNENLPRRASFCGSVNHRQFLTDLTGNRRFLCFETTKINYNHQVPIGKAYAQAKHLVAQGFQFWFDTAEIDEINENNQKYRSCSAEEEMLSLSFEPCKSDEADYYWSATELLNWFAKSGTIQISDASVQKMGKALAASKYLRIKRGNRYVYCLKQKDAELLEYQMKYKLSTDIEG